MYIQIYNNVLKFTSVIKLIPAGLIVPAIESRASRPPVHIQQYFAFGPQVNHPHFNRCYPESLLSGPGVSYPHFSRRYPGTCFRVRGQLPSIQPALSRSFLP